MDLASLSLLICVWMAAALAWGALVSSAAKFADPRGCEGWTCYWLAFVICAAAPPLLAPFFAFLTLPVAPLQVDAALALADWTAPVQREGLPGVLEFAMIAGAVVLIVGASRGAWKLAQVCLRAGRLVRTAAPCRDFGAAPVLISEEQAPAFCVGGPKPAIVLPRALLQSMSADQIRMIVAHEAAHVQRRDPALFLALHCVDIVFWFNPFVRALTARTRLAAEIASDALALQAGADKREYAKAFVQAIERENEQLPAVVAAFGGRGEGPRIRLAYILAGAARQREAWVSGAIIVAASVLCLSSAALAASTGRMAVFGDPVLIAQLDARAAQTYGAPQCGPADPNRLASITSGAR